MRGAVPQVITYDTSAFYLRNKRLCEAIENEVLFTQITDVTLIASSELHHRYLNFHHRNLNFQIQEKIVF